MDIQIQVERDLQGQKFPVPHIVRGANHKSVRVIHEEIRAVQAEPQDDRAVKAVSWVSLLPSLLLHLAVWFSLKHPRWIKETIGMVGVTAIGMFADREGRGYRFTEFAYVWNGG